VSFTVSGLHSDAILGSYECWGMGLLLMDWLEGW